MHNFNRDSFIEDLKKVPLWDIIIIGGGATGLGIALDAASRGFKILLLEQSDFAKGTSSRSTKLIHGGVRYLAQGDIPLVREALKERGLLLENAPHLVKKQAFIIPYFSWFSKIKYLIGLKIYDWLSGKYSFGSSRSLSKKSVLQLMPDLNPKNVQGGIEYYDGQFDDARLAIDIAKTSAKYGASLINYFKVTGLSKDKFGKVNGVLTHDIENGQNHEIKAKVIINATGVFVDDILQMDHPLRKPMTRPSQGIHLVLNRSFWKSNKALMIPKTSDGRVLFAVPWQEHLLIGTTDTPLNSHSIEPIALETEIQFLLNTTKQYFSKEPQREDILSIFAGLRPLAAPDKDIDSTKEISRSHKIYLEKSNLITITGGKWTTYRKMAEDTVNKAIKLGKLANKSCQTYHLAIQNTIGDLTQEEKSIYSVQTMHPIYTITESDVVKAARFEMARTIEDILARRFRILFLNAHVALQLAPLVARILAKELKKDDLWIQMQISEFTHLAQPYLIEYFLNKEGSIATNT